MLLTRKIKKDFTYRDLGGKTITIDREVKPLDVYKLAREGNWACYNFLERRKDFDVFENRKLFYGHVDGLGYLVLETELEDK